MNEDENIFVFITEEFNLIIVELQQNSKVLIKEMNDSKYICAKWLKGCKAIMAFSNQEVWSFIIFFKKNKRSNFSLHFSAIFTKSKKLNYNNFLKKLWVQSHRNKSHIILLF